MSMILLLGRLAPKKKNADGYDNAVYTAWLEKNCLVIDWIQATVGAPMFSLTMNHDLTYDC